MEKDTSTSNSTAEEVMSESTTPKLANPSPEAVIASLSRSIEASSRVLDLASSETDLPLNNLSNSISTDTESSFLSEVPTDNIHIPADSTTADIPQDLSLTDLNLTTTQPSESQQSFLSVASSSLKDENMEDQFVELTTKEVNDDVVVMDSGTAAIGSVEGLGEESIDSIPQPSSLGEPSLSTESPNKTIQDQPIETSGVTPWQDLVISMLSELGFIESSRMMAAEELVLSATQRQNAPSIIQKFSKLLQESTLESRTSAELALGSSSGSSKRNNAGPMDIDSEPHEFVKRRRVDSNNGLAQNHDTREEIEQKMIEFMTTKREQINESNRQEFIKGRPSINVAESGTSESQDADDDGCARVDARKLNRTIQMKQETIKNEALTKTNPKTHAQISDTNVSSSGLDERLRNIQVHLNLRIAAVPVCTIAERVRILEDVIIQLERDYPLWSAIHFNQPNRMFPPPPSVTTVSRNAKNQIVITGDHLHTTLIDHGDPLANPAALAQYPTVGTPHSILGTQTENIQRQGGAQSRNGASIANTLNGGKGTALAGPGKVANTNPAGAGGSATVIKLKRHGGAGSSSLARAVQQQLAQRKANAAAAGQTTDESRVSFSANNNGSTPLFKISPTPHRDSVTDSGLSTTKSGSSSLHVSSPGSASSLSPTIDFSDPLKPGVTGRGPIKSRRKSIAKGLDPVSGISSMATTHTGNILSSNPGTALTSSPMRGTTAGSIANQSSAMSEGSLGSFAISKPKQPTVKKPRKKKGEGNADESGATNRTGTGRGKGGFGLGKGKGGGRPMGLGLGKGKGGAYREELLRRAEIEEFEDESDEDVEDDVEYQSGNINISTTTSVTSSTSNGALATGNTTTFINDNSALAHLVSSALKDQAAQTQQRQQQQQQQQEQQSQSQPSLKSKKQPRKQTTPAKPPPVRKFGGKSFGTAGGSGSSSNESSDGEGTGSSGSQSDSSSSSGSISGSDPGDSD
ncbi:hypothetical protein BGZ49_000520 [Haplosporangium sp. Z 27]|nr:hypothetical protein BGZ49_000520 [Haplosporangium sp. Z 27]